MTERKKVSSNQTVISQTVLSKKGAVMKVIRLRLSSRAQTSLRSNSSGIKTKTVEAPASTEDERLYA